VLDVIKAFTHAQKGKVHEVFVWEFFIPARWDEVCLYGNFSSRLGGIVASVAEILSRQDKWQDHINTL
jgi:hypothetical protein